MSWKRTLLAGITFVLFSMLYFLDRTLGEKAVYQSVNESSLAPGMNLSRISRIELENPKGKTVLVKENGNWSLQEPLQAPADSEIVETVLTNVTGARKTNEIDAGNLAEYGLASPEYRVTLLEDEKRFELLLGNESTYTGLVYAKYVNDPRVFTVGVQVRNTLARASQDFRRSRLFDIDSAELDSYTKVAIVSEDRNLVLQSAGGYWNIASPISSPAESSVVEDFLEKVGLLRASGFVTEQGDGATSLAAALQSLTSPSLTMSVEKQGEPPAVLFVGQVGEPDRPVYVAQRQGDSEVLVLRPDTVDALRQDENVFRSRTLFTLKPRDITALLVEINRAKTELRRDENGLWHFVDDPEKKVDQENLAARLDALLRLRVREYIDVNPADFSIYGLVPPRFKFTVSNSDGSRVENLDTGTGTGNVGSVYARRKGDPSVFTVDFSGDLIILPETIADKRFARTPAERIVRADFQFNGNRYELKREEGEWRLLRPGQTAFATIEAPRVERLLAFLNNLEYSHDYEGDRMIAPSDQPSTIIQFFDDKNEGLLSLTIGKRLQTTTIATTGSGRAYDIRNDDVNRVQALLQSLVQ